MTGRLYSLLDGLIDHAAQWLRMAVALVLCGMMLLTVVDVFGRYIFNRPVLGSFEITEVLLAGLVFCTLPLVSLAREHIAVDLLEHLFKGYAAIVQERVVALLCAGCMAFLAWHLAGKAREAMEYGDVTAALLIPMGPLAWLMCAMSALAAFIMLMQALRGRSMSRAQTAVSSTEHASAATSDDTLP
ncbi:TRAP transporter small permease [Pusillimonas sp.]|uniref:TRAP transporter small permease n=1 Tax=Pusillimonas sp. TaxID=3040095 RepID=UPI0037C966B9